MYEKIHTDAFVIQALDKGEADRVFVLFTRELGLVYAHARSIRKEVAKQRPALQELNRARVSLIRGKQSMRIASAAPIASFVSERFEVRTAMARMLQFVRSVSHDESTDVKIYDILCDGASRMCEQHHAPSDLELLTVMRILSHMGMLKDSERLSLYLKDSMSSDMMRSVITNRTALLRTVNESLYDNQVIDSA